MMQELEATSIGVEPGEPVAAPGVSRPSMARRPPASRAGAVAMIPYIAGLAPLAFVVGATIGEHHGAWAAWLGVWPIFSGSAQMASVRAFHDAGAAAAILTGLAVNTRVAAYGFGVAGRWHPQPRWFRLLAPCLLVDPTFAAYDHYAADHPDLDEQRRFFLAAGLTLGLAFWTLVTAAMLVGGRIGGGLDITVPLCLVVPLGTRVRARPGAVAAAIGAFVIVISDGWPSGTGMLLALAGGVAGGLLVQGGERP